MRIIIDGVFNHMGITSWPFLDVQRRQQDSPYKDWFVVHSWDDPQTGQRFSYEGWAGVAELPELREDEHGLVAGPRDYIFAATRRWMDPDGDGDPSDGIDGWRLDVAFCVSHAFWRAWRQHVRSINPEAFIVGELFGTDEVLASYLQGDTFDAAMNYPFAFACYEYFVHEQHRIDTSTFDRKLADLRAAYPALRRGDLTTLLVDDVHQVYAFQRSHRGQCALVVINRSTEPQQVILPAGEVGQFLDLLNGSENLPVQDGALAVDIAPLWGRILLAG